MVYFSKILILQKVFLGVYKTQVKTSVIELVVFDKCHFDSWQK